MAAFKIRAWLKLTPELNVEHGYVAELRHTLDVQDLLELSSALDDGLHGFSVDVQLWRRQSRLHPLGTEGGVRRERKGYESSGRRCCSRRC